MLVLKRFPWRQRKAKAREYALRSHAPNSLREQRRFDHGPSFETLVWRAKQDRRGEVIREGCTFTGEKIKHWRIVRSLRGRTDQFDLVVDGVTLRTGGRRKIADWLGKSPL